MSAILVRTSPTVLRNKRYDFFFVEDKDKDDILVDNILGILLEDIFRQLILKDKG